jgi:hypothetical protein
MWMGTLIIMTMGVKMTTLTLINLVILARMQQNSTFKIHLIVNTLTLKTILLLPCVAHALLIKMKYIILVP